VGDDIRKQRDRSEDALFLLAVAIALQIVAVATSIVALVINIL
jgi:hypothetical protein